MDELIIRVLQGVASEIDEVRLRAWRQKSPANERRYKQVAALWRATALEAPFGAARATPSADDVIAAVESARPDPSSQSYVGSARGDARRRRMASAARSLLYAAAFAAAGFGLSYLTSDRDPSGLLAQSEIRTGTGEMTTISLGDGSSIRLGSRSSVRIHMEGDTRIADLEGRAFFGVQSERSARFVVRTRYGEAVVLGTRFEVRTEDEEFRVLVVEGRVQVRAGGGEAELGQGEMSVSPAGGLPVRSRVADMYAQLDWMAGALVFQETPMADAVREIATRYRVSIRIDPQLADLTVSATFTDQNLEEILQILSEIINARWVRTDDHLLITRQAAGSDQGR